MFEHASAHTMTHPRFYVEKNWCKQCIICIINNYHGSCSNHALWVAFQHKHRMPCNKTGQINLTLYDRDTNWNLSSLKYRDKEEAIFYLNTDCSFHREAWVVKKVSNPRETQMAQGLKALWLLKLHSMNILFLVVDEFQF